MLVSYKASCVWCAKHTQHAKHEGIWGHAKTGADKVGLLAQKYKHHINYYHKSKKFEGQRCSLT